MDIGLPLITPLLGLAGLGVAFFIYSQIVKLPGGEGRVAEIAGMIERGAKVFMLREFKILSIFVVIIGILIGIFLNNWFEALAFFMGAAASFAAGAIGMAAATKANVRTAVAAHSKGAASALTISFFGGSVMGLTIAAMGLVGVGSLFLFFGTPEKAHVIHAFAMGASLVAIFFRVGGGIFTKAADVGADLVGKIEAGIPEDDPRNPGVIADNVGDNVGDVAGMGSDLFESYCNAMIATMAIAATLTVIDLPALASATTIDSDAFQASLMFLPLAIATIGLICAMIGILIVKSFASKEPAEALRMGTITAAVLLVVFSFFAIRMLGVKWEIWACVFTGSLGGIIVGLVTEYYTGGKPVRDIARSSETGVATVMITGLAVGLQSVAIPIVTIAGMLFVANYFGGIYGVGIAAVGMLATIGITMAIDAYGPIADNAGGIAEMSGMGKETRAITDRLDEVGNTTAAIGKGFAVSAAGLAALTLIAAYVNIIAVNKEDFTLSLTDPLVIIGVFIGGMTAFLNGSITMNAVGAAAHDMIEEIRRQFRETPGILEGSAQPDSARCVDIATSAALKKMMLPASLAVFMPVAVGFGLGPEALGGLLVGGLLGCVTLALFMSNAGGAWDNAKKYVELGNHGGKGSGAHKACVVGDTVGDPFKDTSGPSMNILINTMAIVSLVIAPILI